MRWLFLLVIALAACGTPDKNDIVVMEYGFHCPLHMEQGQDYLKVLPMIGQCGTITLYDDSLCFQGDNDSLNFTLYVIDIKGDPTLSRILCRSSSNGTYLFMISRKKFTSHYDACIITNDGGHYFDVNHVRSSR